MLINRCEKPETVMEFSALYLWYQGRQYITAQVVNITIIPTTLRCHYHAKN